MNRSTAATRIPSIVCRARRWFTASSSSTLPTRALRSCARPSQPADWESAFRAAHTLKGVAQNLGFDALYRAASALTEHLRGGQPLTEPQLLDATAAEHERVMSAIEALG